MQIVRRLYLYLMSGVALGVLLVGLQLLLAVALGALGLGRGEFAGGSATADREQISLAAALAVVGLLVWAVHWWLVEASLRAPAPRGAEERASAIRALYLSVVLGVLLVVGAVGLVSLLGELLRALVGTETGRIDTAGTVAVVVVTGIAWLLHVLTRRRDLAVPVEGAAAWLPRVYLYGAALVGGLLLLDAVGQLLGLLVAIAVGEEAIFGGGRREAIASAVAAVAVWAAVWVGHLWYSTRVTRHADWRGAGERPARLRVAYFVLAIGGSAAWTIWHAAALGQAVFVLLLDAREAAGVDAGLSPVLAIGAPLLAVLPWAAAWWLHHRWLRAEAVASGEDARVATADRLDAGAVALPALAFTAVGTGWLLGMLLDVLLGGTRTVGEFWRVELAQYLSYAIAGVAPWVWNAARLRRRAAVDPHAEASSPVRRSLLLIILAAGVLTSLGSLAFVLYRAFGTLLGVGFVGNPVSALSTPLGALIVGVAVVAMHAIDLRRDQRLRAELAPPADAAPPAEARRTLVLAGPDAAAIEAALVAMRAQLPAGYRLESADEAGAPGS